MLYLMLKTESLPPIRIDAATKRSIQKLLRPEETISSFVEDAVRKTLARRKLDKEFLARGLANAKAARETNDYVSADEVMKRLNAKFRKRK